MSSKALEPNDPKDAAAGELPGGTGGPRLTNFISEIIDADLASGKHTTVVTRFPPEPNGYLHIGHAKAICLNFGIAEQYGGMCRLRFDDTNPATEETEYVDGITRDVAWLGVRWEGDVRFASSYFDQLYAWAEGLIEKGVAYVDSLSQEQIREYRGTPYEPGRNSPDRDRPAAESLDLFRRMKAGEFPAGTYVLRAKGDMASPNIVMRDPPLYRIVHGAHHRTGDAWHVYPMYDYAHCLEDAIEGVTHSLCTLEFQDNREIYDWLIEHVDPPDHPRQIEFARLNLGYTIVSKRKLRLLVEEGHVTGWDDPRMPTLCALRRRGVTPAAIRAFCTMIGVAKADSTVDIGKLEYCIRDDLNALAPRIMGVLRPLRVVITNYPEDQVEELDAPYFPEDVGKAGSRKVPFSRELFIERDDFAVDPPKKWFRLAPGREVRLRYGYFIRCEEVVTDPSTGEVTELRCTYDPATRGGDAPDGRKVKGTLHWVSAAQSLPAEVRLYDRLFTAERPGADGDFLDDLNPESLVTHGDARVEPSVADDEDDLRYQFERQGYFIRDAVDSRPDRLVFNRIVGLRDSWAKVAGKAEAEGGGRGASSDSARTQGRGDGTDPAGAAERGKPSNGARAKGRGDGTDPAGAAGPSDSDRDAGPSEPRVTDRDRARDADPELAARFARYTDELSIPRAEADVLSGDRDLAMFFEEAMTHPAGAPSLAKWIVNELLGATKGRAVEDLPFGPREVAALVALVDDGTISAPGGKDVLAEMLERGGDPAAIVEAKGLRRVSDDDALVPLIDAALADNADKVERYRAGETKLIGFFMGEAMRATRGAADPGRLKELLLARLDG